MIYLTTGANGAGKTLLTLRDVHAKALKESRPVYHNGRFEVDPDGPLAAWKVIDAKDWQTVDDGAIFLFDECHNDFPTRGGHAPAPDYIKMLAEHRRRGFDFYLITQHPNNLDAFVRRLIGAPGWHRHIKRASGAPLVSVLEWPSVNGNCEKAGSGDSGAVSMVKYPTEVFKWYRSTSLDTAKIKLPFMAKVLIGLVLVAPAIGWYAWHTVQNNTLNIAKNKVGPGAEPDIASAASGAAPVVKSMTTAEYVQSFAPRVPGLPYTAPRYDGLTAAVEAPFPAGCLATATKCTCYTQQATKLDTTDDICRQIVKDGYFKDWGSVGGGKGPIRPNGPDQLTKV